MGKRVEKARYLGRKTGLLESRVSVVLLSLLAFGLFGWTSSQYVRVPVESCPGSFSLVNGVCTHIIETQKIPVCPESYASKGEECYSAEPILKECPTGFVMQDKQCVREVFAEKEASCPAGLTLDSNSGKCLYREEVGPICPPGSVHFGEGCATSREPLKVCPKPLIYDSSSELCLERNVTTPFVECPESFAFDSESGICAREDIEKPECPDGFEEVSDNQCAKWIIPERSCTKGTQMQTLTIPGTGTLCRSTTYTNSTLVCPPDTRLEGEVCVSKESISERVCPRGYVEMQGGCVKYQDPEFFCPKGLEESIQNGIKVCLSTVSVSPEISCPKANSFFDETLKLCILETASEKECPENSFSRGNSCFQKIQGNWDCPPGSRYDGETHSCFETLTMEPTATCPVNTRFDEHSLTCTGYTSNAQICPPGYEEIGDGECAAFLSPRRSCPEKFSLVEGQCEKITLSSPKVTCPPGSELTAESFCSMSSDNANRRKCPRNSYDSGDHCSIYETPEKQCLEGYNLNRETDKCVKMVSRPAEAFCREPSTFGDNDECVQIVELQKSCPIGFKEDPANQNFCLKERSPKVVCPDGYFLESQGCTKESKVSIELACPAGYKVDESDNNCHRVEKRTKVCPPGFLDNGEDCFRTSSPSSVCPPGYSREDKFGDCVELKINIPEVKCPKGSLDNGSSCIIKRPLSLEYRCPKGSRVGDSCVSEVFLPAVYECPHGYSLSEAKQCQKSVEYDCSEVNVVQVPCSNGSAKNTGVLNYYSTGANLVCSEIVKNPKTCIRTEAVPAKVTCPFGTISIGKECMRKEHTQMTKVCSDSSKEPENCYQIIEIKKVDYCPPDFSKTEDGKCALLARTAPNLECPEGYTTEGGNCVQRTSKICPPEGCTTNNVLESSAVCPDGYEMINEICVFKHIVEPTHICDVGTNILGPKGEYLCQERTLKTCIGNSCETVQKHPFEYKCEVNERFNSQTKRCESTVIGPKILKCEKPFKLVGDQCIHNTPKECTGGNCSISISVKPRYKCESGTLISDGKCEAIEKIPADLSCPDEYALEKDMCVKHSFKECLNEQCEKKISYFPIIECPSQYERLPNGICGRKIAHLPRLVCPQGYTLFNSYCAREIEPTCPADGCFIRETLIPVIKCPSGFEKNHRNFVLGLDSVCSKKLFRDGEVACPDDSVYSNGTCQTYSEKQCFGGDCERYKTSVPKRICPEGSKLLSNGICEVSETLPMDMYCPEGFQLEGDKCVKFREKLCKRKNCVIKQVAEPLVSCQSGFHLKGGTVCVRERFSPGSNSCPSDYKMVNGRCLRIFSKECPDGTCERNTLVDPSLSCPKGFVDVGNRCIYLEYSGHKKTCPPGSFIQKNYCIRFAKPEFKCPEGFDEEAGKCTREVKTEAIVTYDSHCMGNSCNNRNESSLHISHNHKNHHSFSQKHKKYH